jgi:hypothetical protein
LNLLLVLALLRGFFSGYSGFHSPAKTNISKFRFHQVREPAWKPAKVDVAYSLNSNLGCVSLGKSKIGFLNPKTNFAFLY